MSHPAGRRSGNSMPKVGVEGRVSSFEWVKLNHQDMDRRFWSTVPRTKVLFGVRKVGVTGRGRLFNSRQETKPTFRCTSPKKWWPGGPQHLSCQQAGSGHRSHCGKGQLAESAVGKNARSDPHGRFLGFPFCVGEK